MQPHSPTQREPRKGRCAARSSHPSLQAASGSWRVDRPELCEGRAWSELSDAVTRQPEEYRNRIVSETLYKTAKGCEIEGSHSEGAEKTAMGTLGTCWFDFWRHPFKLHRAVTIRSRIPTMCGRITKYIALVAAAAPLAEAFLGSSVPSLRYSSAPSASCRVSPRNAALPAYLCRGIPRAPTLSASAPAARPGWSTAAR